MNAFKMSEFRPMLSEDEASRERVFEAVKQLFVNVKDWSEALHFRKLEDKLPLVTIRILDQVVQIVQAGRFYALHKRIQFRDFGHTINPGSLFHPTSRPPVQYEACEDAPAWLENNLMMSAIHLIYIWGFTPTTRPESQRNTTSAPTKNIAIAAATLVGIKHTNTASDNKTLTAEHAPDVTIDWIHVIRTTGQAVIPCCAPCRLRGLEKLCPIAGLVIDPLEYYKGRRYDILERAHFPGNDTDYQKIIRPILFDTEFDQERKTLFFHTGETWEVAKGAPIGSFVDYKRPERFRIYDQFMVTAKQTSTGTSPTVYIEGYRGLDDLDISAMRVMCRREFEHNGGTITAIPGSFPTDDDNDYPYYQHPSITHANMDFPKPAWYYLAHAPVQAWPIDMLKLYEDSTGSILPSGPPPPIDQVERLHPAMAVPRRRNVDRLRNPQHSLATVVAPEDRDTTQARGNDR